MRGVPVRIGGGAVLDMRSVPVVIDVQRKCRPGTRVWATARRVDRMWWGETRGYQGGLCQRWGMYVCMYVCMYDYRPWVAWPAARIRDFAAGIAMVLRLRDNLHGFLCSARPN